MRDFRYDKPELLEAFIKSAQYIVRLRTQQDVWDHLGKFIVTHFPADWTAFALRDPVKGISIHHCTPPDGVIPQSILTDELRTLISDVLDSGFLASQVVLTPAPSMTAFLPIMEEYRTEMVMLIGHKAVDPLPKPLLNIYLAVAGLAGTAFERLQNERELNRHRAHLEELVKERTAELAKAKRQNELILHSVGEGICGLDLEGRITFVNPSAAQIIGWDPDELIGRNAHATFHHTRPDGCSYPVEECPVYSALRNMNGNPIANEEFLRKDGARFPVEFITAPVQEEGNIVGAVVVFRDITERKRAEEAIKKSLGEKEALLKEIHHRVKNNLQIIYSMLNLQLPQIKDEQAIELFRESQNRVHSMALIHEKLYQSESLARLDLAEYVRSLTANLFLSYGVSERIVKPRISVQNLPLDIDTVIPCALIINELVSNSLKHAFPGLKRVQGSGSRGFNTERGTVNGEPFVQGEIRVEMRRGSEVQSSKVSGSEFKGSKVKDSNPEPGTLNGERVIVLTVSDNGVGLPKGIQIQRCQSLGLKLVSVLVKQIKGAIHVGEREGTEFVITFKAKK